MKYVMKFGGSCLINGEGIRKVARIITENVEKGHQVVAVVSALSGVTDELMFIAKKAQEKQVEEVDAFLKRFEERHVETIRRAIDDQMIIGEVVRSILNEMGELKESLTAIERVGSLSVQRMDLVISFGERLSSLILLGALQGLGVKAKRLAREEVGIVTDSAFGMARPIKETTVKEVRSRIRPLLHEKICPIVTGFIATDTKGETTTLGRGGSDYSATLIGSALGVDEVWIWIDVDGIMTADPDVVPKAKTLPVLSYAEASELAHLRTPPLHPKTLEPAMERSIPVRIKNILNPKGAGTLIIHEPERYEGVVKAIAIIRDMAIVTVAGTGMIEMPGTAARVFECVGRNKVNILMIAQSCSESSISLLVKGDDLATAVMALNTEFRDRTVVEQIIAEQDVAAVAAIGAGMRGTPGIASKIFSAVSRKGANVLMIAQGSSELNISFVVSDVDGEEAVRTIHEEFQLQNL
jgi:aspartate kinase